MRISLLLVILLTLSRLAGAEPINCDFPFNPVTYLNASSVLIHNDSPCTNDYTFQVFLVPLFPDGTPDPDYTHESYLNGTYATIAPGASALLSVYVPIGPCGATLQTDVYAGVRDQQLDLHYPVTYYRGSFWIDGNGGKCPDGPPEPPTGCQVNCEPPIEPPCDCPPPIIPPPPVPAPEPATWALVGTGLLFLRRFRS